MVRGNVCNEGGERELLFECPAQDWHIFLHKREARGALERRAIHSTLNLSLFDLYLMML